MFPEALVELINFLGGLAPSPVAGGARAQGEHRGPHALPGRRSKFGASGAQSVRPSSSPGLGGDTGRGASAEAADLAQTGWLCAVIPNSCQ